VPSTDTVRINPPPPRALSVIATGPSQTPSMLAGSRSVAARLGSIYMRAKVAAISVGMVGDKHLVDLNYQEDSKAQVDLNVVASATGALVEVQGTAEGAPVPKADFDRLLELGVGAMPTLVKAQHAALAEAGVDLSKLMG